MTVTNETLLDWANYVDVTRLPLAEGEIDALQSQQALDTAEITQQGQTFNDWLTQHDVTIQVAQDSADNANTKADQALIGLTDLDLDLQAYIQAQLQILRNTLEAQVNGQLYSLDQILRDHVNNTVGSISPDLQFALDQRVGTVDALVAAAMQDVDAAKLVAEEIVSDLFPALDIRIEHTELLQNSLLNRFNELIQDFSYDSLADRFSLVEDRIQDEKEALFQNIERLRDNSAYVEKAVNSINENMAFALLRLTSTESLVRDAGIFIDPESGLVRISAVDAVAGQVNDVSITLDALSAEISLKASVAYVNQAVSEAILDPSQIPLIGDLEFRLTEAELNIDGFEAALLLKGDATVVNAQGARLTEAEIAIDGLEGEITLKVNTSDFDVVESRVTDAEQVLSTIDGAKITRSVRDSRTSLLQNEIGSITTLGELLRAHQNNENTRSDLAYIQEDFHSVVTENREAISTLRTELGSAIDDVAVGLVTNYYTKASTDAAVAEASLLLAGRIDDAEGSIADITSLNLSPTSAIMERFTSLEGDLDTADGKILDIINLTLDPESVLASKISLMEGDIDNAEAAIVDILELDIDPQSALLIKLTNLEGDLDTATGSISDILNLTMDPNSVFAGALTSINTDLDILEDQNRGSYLKNILQVSDLQQGSAVVLTAGPAAMSAASSVVVSENSTARSFSGGTNGASFLLPAHNTAVMSGSRVRVDILARRHTTDPSVAFSAGYKNHEGTNSGFFSFSVPADFKWRWFTFYYDRPAGQWVSDAQDRIIIWGDDSKSNKKLEISRVVARAGEDLSQDPEINTLSGRLTDMAALDLNALDGTAFGAFLEQLEVDAAGISAVVTNQASALSDLEGFSSAYAGITASTSGPGGTQISGFYATSYSNPDGSGNALLELLGDVVAEGTLATNRLVVGLGRNLLTNTSFTSGLAAGWGFSKGPAGSHFAQVSCAINPAGQLWAGSYYNTIKIIQNGVDTDGYADFYSMTLVPDGTAQIGNPIEGGSWLDVSFRGSTHDCDVELRIRYADASGTYLSYSPILDSGSKGTGADNRPSNWPVYWGKHQAPANASYAAIHIRKKPTYNGANGSALYISEPQLAVTHEAASMPVPYSPQGTTVITGDEIVTGAIKARHAIFESLAALNLTVGEADIEELAVNRSHLQDAIIGSAQIQFGEVDTLHLRGRAVTIPSHGWNPAEITHANVLVQIGSVTIDREANFITRLHCSFHHSGVTSTAWLNVHLTRQIGAGPETTLMAFDLSPGGQHGAMVPLGYVDTDVTGDTTVYRLKAQMVGSLDPGNVALKTKLVACQALQFKR